MKWNSFFWWLDKEYSYKYNHVLFANSLSEVPQDTQNYIYVVNRDNYKWAIFMCPEGCGRRIEVNLMQSKYPSWKLSLKKNKASLLPSVVVEDCGAHFWLSNNKVYWARFK